MQRRACLLGRTIVRSCNAVMALRCLSGQKSVLISRRAKHYMWDFRPLLEFLADELRSARETRHLATFRTRTDADAQRPPVAARTLHPRGRRDAASTSAGLCICPSQATGATDNIMWIRTTIPCKREMRCVARPTAVGPGSRPITRTDTYRHRRQGCAGSNSPPAMRKIAHQSVSYAAAYTLAPASPYRRRCIAGGSFYADADADSELADKADLFAQGGACEHTEGAKVVLQAATTLASEEAADSERRNAGPRTAAWRAPSIIIMIPTFRRDTLDEAEHSAARLYLQRPELAEP
jgi:hypothetical protein